MGLRMKGNSVNDIRTAVLVCLLVEVLNQECKLEVNNLVSGSPNWWMRCIGTGILLSCQIPQARMILVSPWTAVNKAQPSPKLLFFLCLRTFATAEVVEGF